MAWNVLEQLNKNAVAAVVDETPKARFRTKDISIKKMYSNDKNFYSMVDIEQLAQDIYVFGLIENLEVIYEPCDKGEYRITAGERRWRALNLLVEQGHKEFEIATCQIQTPASRGEEILRLIVANAYRNKTVTDILEEEKQLKETLQRMKEEGKTIKGYKLDSGRLRDVIADMLRMPTTKIAQIESINKHLIPEFTKELKEGRLTFSAAYEISGMNEEAQQSMLQRYEENGLTFKEVREIKKQQEEKATEQLEGQLTFDEVEQIVNNDTNIEDEQLKMSGNTDEENTEEEWQDAHPESITSICYSCKRYSECNVKTGTCKNCDRYINKAEAEKTEEQKYNEQQDKIDKETKKKLQEQADNDKMQHLPSEQPKNIHHVKLGETFFEDVKTGRKSFELRKNDRGYKQGDMIVFYEYKDGKYTPNLIKKKIVYVLQDFTGLEEGFCILGLGELD